jgi:DMSO/TMAO reductase YedYZ heme-binding membrane subunit
MLLYGAVDEKLAWYISRSSGLIAWVVVTASIVWGLTLSTRLIRKRGAPAWLLDLHRYLGTLSLIFTAIHVISLPFDSYAHIAVKELLLPFQSLGRNGYKPEPIAWGIAGFYLLVAIQITSWLKKRLPRKLWHGVHLLSIPLFFVATVHGFKAGSEKENPLVFVTVIIGSTLFFFLFLFRIFSVVGQDDRAADRELRDGDVAGTNPVRGQRPETLRPETLRPETLRPETSGLSEGSSYALIPDATKSANVNWGPDSNAVPQASSDNEADEATSITNSSPADQQAEDRAARIAALQASRRGRVSTR